MPNALTWRARPWLWSPVMCRWLMGRKKCDDTTVKLSNSSKLDVLKYNENPRYLLYRAPGFNFNIYDRNNLPNLPVLMVETGKMRVKGRKHIINAETGSRFFNMDDLFKDGLVFVACTHLNLSPLLWDSEVKNSHLEVQFSIGSVGKSSFSFVTDIFSEGSKVSLVKDMIKFIFIGKDTRKPIALPTWFLDEYKGKGVMEDEPFYVSRFDRPERTFTHHVQVMWLDTDINNHTNFSSYARFAINAIHFWLLIKAKSDIQELNKSRNDFWHGDLSALDGFTDEMIKGGLKDAKISYLGECKEGDELYIHIWNHPDFIHKVNVSIEKQNGPLLCQLTLEYFI